MFVERFGNSIYDISHMEQDVSNEYLHYNHMHYYCELVFFIEGDVDYCIDGDYYHLQPYDLLLIPAGTYHYSTMRSAVRYENYVIHFYDNLLPPDKLEKLFTPPTVFNIGADPQLQQFFKLLDTYHDLYDTHDFLTCAQCLIKEILIYCCYISRLPKPIIRKQPLLIQNILNYINDHLEEELDADILAEYLHMSRSHIQNIFSQTMKIGLKQYIMQEKIFAAHNDLLNGLSPTKITDKYHFNDYSTFYRLYKKTFGDSPSSSSSKE